MRRSVYMLNPQFNDTVVDFTNQSYLFILTNPMIHNLSIHLSAVMNWHFIFRWSFYSKAH